MYLLKRPKAPPGFNGGAREARRTIRKMVSSGARPKSSDFVDCWSAFKAVLAEAQHGRCGYCDRYVIGGEHGTIDHYYPKAAVDALHDDPSTWGTQKAYSASVHGRQKKPVSEWGYHWLAYAWMNFVFACSCCNEGWKRTYFPVAVAPRQCPPQPRMQEEPLLLNCYRALRPSAHLRFNEDGSVERLAGSLYGFETIRTVGLDRDGLRRERVHVTRAVHQSLRDYGSTDYARMVRGKRGLRDLGGETRPFAGVVRAIVEEMLAITWEEFLTL
jgi:hypothetical protein